MGGQGRAGEGRGEDLEARPKRLEALVTGILRAAMLVTVLGRCSPVQSSPDL